MREVQVELTEIMGRRSVFRDLLSGVIKVYVLHHACGGDIYGAGITSDLEQRGYRLSSGTLYPLLHGLASADLLEREDRLVAGRIRKYYRITNRGRRALDEARRELAELVDELTGRHRVARRASVMAMSGPHRSG